MICSLTLSAQIDTGKYDAPKPVTLGVAYTGDVVSNFRGGIKTGTNYLGLVQLAAELNTEALKLWKGGSLFVNLSNAHGGTPSATLIGDLQVASNIEAGNHTYIQEFWYKQAWEKLEVVFGVQDLNVEYVVCEHASHYLNSSFGVTPTISSNIPAPIFPLTALGLTLKYHITDNFTWQYSAFDGDPASFETNPHNLKWNLSKRDGILNVSEIQYSNNQKGNFKVGGFYHAHYSESILGTENNFGLYALGCQNLFHNDSKNRDIQAFLQVASSPMKTNENYGYIGGGINFTGYLPFKLENTFGIAFAHTVLRNRPNETSIELTCKIDLNEHFYIQPDLQYIISPAGTDVSLPNAFVGFFRFGVAI